MQIVPTPPLQQAVGSVLARMASSGRAVAAAALLALPLLAVARPFRSMQLMPAAPVVTDASSSTLGSVSRASSQQRVQPVNPQLSSVELHQLCAAVAAQLAGRVWLPETVALSAGGDKGTTAAAAASSPGGDLVFQVVVDRSGRVLGFKPCSPAAAAVFLEVPLAAALRGADLAKVQAK